MGVGRKYKEQDNSFSNNEEQAGEIRSINSELTKWEIYHNRLLKESDYKKDIAEKISSEFQKSSKLEIRSYFKENNERKWDSLLLFLMNNKYQTSWENVLMILLQTPNAKNVGTEQSWAKNHIKINADNGNLIIDEDGKATIVFDTSQTTSNPNKKTVEEVGEVYKNVLRSSPVPVFSKKNVVGVNFDKQDLVIKKEYKEWESEEEQAQELLHLAKVIVEVKLYIDKPFLRSDIAESIKSAVGKVVIGRTVFAPDNLSFDLPNNLSEEGEIYLLEKIISLSIELISDKGKGELLEDGEEVGRKNGRLENRSGGNFAY